MIRLFSFFKNSFVVLWRRHHLIVPPKYWGRYFNSFKRKIFSIREYYNPFIIKEYNEWLELNKKKTEYIDLKYKPLISFIIPVYNIEKDFLKDCLDSILNQSYSNFEICIADDNSTKEETLETLKEYEKKDSRVKVVYRKENGHISKATNSALEITTGEYIALMDDDDILDKDALYKMVLQLNKDKDIDFIYSDEDKQDMNGRLCEPHFKPDFSKYSFYGGNFICHFTIIKKSLLDKIGNFDGEYVGAQDFDLFLRATEQAKKIYHIPECLYHWRKVPGSTADTIGNKVYAIENGKKAVEESLRREGLDGYVTTPIKTTHYVVHFNVRNNPLISIIMLDNTKRSIKNNLKQIRKCNYKNIEIIINNDKNININEENVTIKSGDVNKLIKESNGEYVMLISGKFKIEDTNLLNEMLGYAMQKDIGAVGPKIYHYGKTVKSAGVVTSNEYIYVNAFSNYFTDSYGVYGRLLVPYSYNVISDICLMFSKRKYNEVGGFDNSIDFTLSSIDFCLKLRKNGYQNILLGNTFIHQKDYKRTHRYDITDEDKNILRSKWDLDNDIYYNVNLNKEYPFMLEADKHEK